MSLIFRVLLGYLIACLVAGLTTVLFAWTPSDLASMQGDAANDKLALAMPVATHIALFVAPVALLAIAYAERYRRHDWLYYALAGVAIALLGFGAQLMSEDSRQTWSITNNNYPLFAFITTGFLSGLAYWIFSGRMAGLGLAKPAGMPHRPGTPEMNRKPGTPVNRPNPQRP